MVSYRSFISERDYLTVAPTRAWGEEGLFVSGFGIFGGWEANRLLKTARGATRFLF